MDSEYSFELKSTLNDLFILISLFKMIFRTHFLESKSYEMNGLDNFFGSKMESK